MQKSYYFQHDYNASNDAKVLFLRQQLGMEGYGIYWFILEQLAQSGGYLPLKIIPVLAMQTQTQETKVNAVIRSYDLFQITQDNFFSYRMNDHLGIRKMLSEKGKAGAIKRWLKDSPPNSPPISPPNAKERKGKQSKVKEISIPPEKSEVVNFMQTKLDDFTAMGQAESFMNFYESKGWVVGKNKMKNWKAAASGWINRMSQFQKIEPKQINSVKI